MTGYVSTQFGSGYEYRAGEGSIETWRGSARIEELWVGGPPRAARLMPFFHIPRGENMHIRNGVFRGGERDWKCWWLAEAKKLHWFKEPTEILDESNPPFYKWFADGKLNASYNCLDRHVGAGDGDRIALHWRGEGGEERDLTYSDFHRDVLGESASRARDAACRQRFEQNIVSGRARGAIGAPQRKYFTLDADALRAAIMLRAKGT